MGSFSFTRADMATKRSNIVDSDVYKILIPEEFGGGYIKDKYSDCGEVFEYDNSRENADLYGILAYWNHCPDMIYDGDEYPKSMDDILKRGHTDWQENRTKGIQIGCYDTQINKLKYPLKLVSVSCNKTYEECKGRSYGDPEQGFRKTYWKNTEIWKGMEVDTMEDIRICPKCGKTYAERPAISRIDNSEICPECGALEAIDAAGWSEEEKEEGMRLVRESLKEAKASK